MNAREVGRQYARLGLSIEDMADAFGVGDEWAWAARRDGASSIAQAAWEYAHPDLRFVPPEDRDAATQEQRGEVEACLGIARFARAVNEYARTPFGTQAPTRVTHQLVTKFEEYGDAESGPQGHVWYEVEEVGASV